MRFFAILLSFFFSTKLLGATTATTENEPSALVNGVNVITGDLYLLEEDLVVQGAEPIRLQRHYISSKGQGYWNMFSYHRAFIDFSSKVIEVVEEGGARLYYQWKEKSHKNKKRTTFYSIDLGEESSKGLTNTARGKPSGKTNLKNQNIEMSDDFYKFWVLCPDGTKRFYERYYDRRKNFAIDEFMDWNVSSLPSCDGFYLLIKEELPNGRQIIYEWPKDKKDTWQIKTCDASQKMTYAWVKFYPHNGEGDKSHGDYGVETSDGRHLEYLFFTYNKVHQLKQVTSDEKPDQTYQYCTYGKRKILKRILLPEGRYKYINYYSPMECSGGESAEECFRVKELIGPAGEKGEGVSTHRFFYDLPNKKTTVLDPYDVPTEYYWNDDLRLVQINRFTKLGCLKTQEKFIWGGNDSKDGSNLLCKVTFDESEKPIVATRYVYDDFGNVEKETLYGNLTGEGACLELDLEGFPVEGSSESYSKWSTYSQEGKNLLLTQKEENGLSVSYTYFKNTPLVEIETYYAHEIPQKRKIYSYDASGILYEEITEDLQGNFYVTLNIRNKEASRPHKRGFVHEYPAFPMVIDESCGKGPAKRFLKETAINYTAGGRILNKKIFDSKGKLENSFEYLYKKGCLKSELNALGHRARSSYDKLNNLIKHSDFAGRLETHIQYDLLNRPILSKEEGEGLSRIHSCKHDLLGYKIESTDPYGHKTFYEYDSLGHLLKTTLPSGGIITSEYDSLGNPISETDAKGYETKTTYNIYGKPTQVTYPNGAVERFIYHKEGTLKEHFDQEGTKTSYTYDVFGRVLAKVTPYSEESKTYDSFNLLSETDAEGIATYYEYDEAGRKILEKRGEEQIHYAYDAFGRLHRTTSGEFSLLKFYDTLNRVIEEKKVDALDTLLQFVKYDYDPSGNLISTKRSIDGKKVEEVLEYDALKRVVKQIDAAGYITRTDYDDESHKQTITDPLGLQTITSFNESNQVSLLEKYSKEGTCLFREMHTYDLNQNLSRKETITPSLSTVTLWEYNEMNRLIFLTEGAGTSDKKITAYSYTPKGQLYQTIKPSGVILTNTYSPSGDLESQVSSDGTIHYSYVYDRNGQLLASTDEITRQTVTRSYTPQGRLLQETLPIGFIFKSSYDSTGRRTFLELPDSSGIRYDYDALYLRSVSRVKNGKTLYAHRYTSYDLSGNLTEEIPFTNLQISYSYNTLGRKIEVLSSYFSEKATAFDPAGNLLAKNRNGKSFSYTYDALYQLTSEQDHTYGFDALHNRLQKDQKTFEINSLNQTSELIYNLDGNPTVFHGKKLFYDALDRLIQVEDGFQRILYTYDSFHRRLSKKIYTARDLTTDLSYLYDDQNEIGAFDHLLGEFIELRILGNAPYAEIGASIALELHGKIYIPIHDLHGNIAAIANLDGSLENYSYTAFGEEENPNLSPWRFSSKRIDPETSFVYFGRRFYIPELGRFLTPDPLGFEAGPNLYAYVSNSPLTHFDPYGLFESGLNIEEQRLRNDDMAVVFGSFYQNFYDNHQPTIYTVGEKEIPGCHFIFVNGIDTTKKEAMDYARIVSDYGGGVKVHGIHNPTSGKILDPINAMVGFTRFRDTSSLLGDHCREFFARNPSGSQKAFITCHSDGATHVYQYLKSLSPAQQQRFIVLAIAPATVISDNICFKAYNFSSKRDFIPCARWVTSQACFNSMPFGTDIEKRYSYSARTFKELEFLTPHPNAKLLDHSFNSPTFEAPIKRTIIKHISVGLDIQ
jgi:RHS repeat-associated protein